MSSNALTQFLNSQGGDLQVNDQQMADALTQTAEDTTTGGGNVTYLNFSGKLGKYSLGRDREDLDPEEVFLLEPQSIFTGWQCWKSSKPVDKYKWSVYQPEQRVREEDLPDHGPYRQSHGEGWKKMLGLGVVTLDGNGQSIEFSTDSVSGRNAIGDIMNEIAQRARAGEPTVPLVRFDKEEFTAQEQKNYKPKIIVEAWVDREQAAAYFSTQIEYSMDDLLSGKRLTTAQRKKLQPAA